jgi:chaperonin cofactor prefoldin
MRLSSFFIFIFLTFNLIGQTDPYPKVIVHNSDTVLAFTLAQARKLSVFNEERKECLDLKSDLESQIKELEKVKQEQDKQLLNMDKVQKDYNDILVAVKDNKALCDSEKKILETKRDDQIKYKRFSIGAGILTTFFMTYLYITK